MRAALLIVLVAMIAAMILSAIAMKAWNYFNYHCFQAVLREEGFSRGQAIDFADENPQIWKTDFFRSIF